jgi:hypothetical protein
VELRLEIDKSKLDEECQNQAPQTEHFSRLLADATLEWDQRKAELALMDAKLDREIRESPEDFGISKLTETVISNMILIQAERVRAQESLNKAKHVAGVLQAAVSGLVDRKKSLVCLIELFAMGYFSSPAMPDVEGVRGRTRRVREFADE